MMKFTRDPNSNAVLSTDTSYYDILRGSRESTRKILKLQNDLKGLQQEVAGIKEILNQILAAKERNGE